MPAATTTSRRLIHQRRSTALPPICSGEGSIRPGGAGHRRRPRMRSAHRAPESREQQLAAERRTKKRVAGATPLMYACQQARDQHVRALLQEKPDRVVTRDRTMKSALHYCAENATPASAELVLAAAPELLDAKDDDGFTALHLAVIAGNVSLVRFLLQRHADLSALDNESHSVVHWATVCGEVDALEALLDAGAEASTPDIHGGYPLHYAAQMCGVNSEMGNDPRAGLFVLRALLGREVDVHVKDQDGRQPILWAASAGSADAVLALVNAGANVEADDKDGLTALHCAASRGHTECLETLVTLCGAEVNVIDSNGCTALFYAVTLGHADCTQLLLNFGAEPNRQDRKGRTAAHCGAAKGQLETLKLLGSAGADLWTRNVKGDLPLHEAVQSGRRELVHWLLAQRPDTITAANSDGRTALHVAAVNNNVEMCKVIIDGQSFVNPVMRGAKGQMMTPLDAALLRGNRGCAKYLQLHGGVPASKLTEEAAAIRGQHRSTSDSQLGGSVSPAAAYDLMLLTPRGEPMSASPSPRTSATLKIPPPSDQMTQTHDEMFPEQPALSETGSARHKTRRLRSKTKSPSLQPPASSSDSEVASEVPLESSRRRRSPRRGTSKTKRKSAEEKTSRGEKQPAPQKQSQVTAVVEKEPLTATEAEKQSTVEKQLEVSEEVTAVSEKVNTVSSKVTAVTAKVTAEVSLVTAEQAATEGDKQSSTGKHSEVHHTSNNESSLSKSDSRNSTETKDTSKNGSSDSNKPEINDEIAVKPTENTEIENDTKTSELVKNSSVENNTDIPAQTSSSQENSQIAISINESENQPILTTNSETTQNVEVTNKVHKEVKIEISEDYDIKCEAEMANQLTEINENKNSENTVSEQIAESAPPQQNESKQEIEAVEEKVENDDKIVQGDETKEAETKVAEIIAAETTGAETTGAETKTAESAQNVEDGKKEETEVKSSPEGTEHKTSDDDNNKTTKTDNSESSVPPLKSDKLKKKTLASKKPENHVDAAKSKKTRRKVESEKSTSNSDKDDSHVREVRPQPKARSKSREGGKRNPETKLKKDARNKELKVARKSSEEDHSQKSTESSFTSESSTRSKAADSGVMLIDSLSGSPQLPRHKANKVISSQVTPRKVTERKLQLRTHQHDVREDARKAREILRQRQQQSVVSVTQAVQVSTRKYQLERRIFQELLELKRLQIRAGRSNEQVLVKRAVDEYRSAGLIVGLRQYDGPYHFRDFEQYLYEQLTVLQQSADAHLVARLKPSDDVESLSAALRRSLPGMPGALHHSAAFCTLSTHRCRHATEAYTGMPVATYVNRQSPGARLSPESFLPRIEASPSRSTPAPPRSASRSLHQVDPSRPVTLELSHGGEKQVISLPTERLDRTKRYYVTFTIKPGDGQAKAVASTGSAEDLLHRHAKSL